MISDCSGVFSFSITTASHDTASSDPDPEHFEDVDEQLSDSSLIPVFSFQSSLKFMRKTVLKPSDCSFSIRICLENALDDLRGCVGERGIESEKLDGEMDGSVCKLES